MPSIYRVVVRGLSDESEGNAVGMGLVDFSTERFWRQVDFDITLLNAVTGAAPANGRSPAILKNDREAVSAALLTSPRRPAGPLLAYIRDTLELEKVYLSEACLPLVEPADHVEILTKPSELRFDEEGNIVSPFTTS
jgi:hypothetical protein